MPALVYYYLFLLIYIFVIYLINQDQLKKNLIAHMIIYTKNGSVRLTCGPIGYPGWDWPSWLCSDGLLLASDWTEPSRPPGGAEMRTRGRERE